MNTWKITVHYFRKPAVLNPEEPTTLRALQSLKFDQIEKIQMGGCFILTINSPNRASAVKVATGACDKFLVNLVTSGYEITQVTEVISEDALDAFMDGVQADSAKQDDRLGELSNGLADIQVALYSDEGSPKQVGRFVTRDGGGMTFQEDVVPDGAKTAGVPETHPDGDSGP